MFSSMDLNVVLLLIVSSVVSGQINGEFWWLNSDLTKLKHGTVEAPMFDDVNELDTDESAKVVFKENVINQKTEPRLKKNPKSLNNENLSGAIHFRDDTSLANVFNQVVHINVNNKLWNSPQDKKYNKTNLSVRNDDEFQFIFPDERNLLWFTSENETKTYEKKLKQDQPVKAMNTIENTITYNDISTEDKNKLKSENICTFIKKSKCIDNAGTLYTPWAKKEIQTIISNEHIVCCILPITTTPNSKISFPDSDWHTQRTKRSNSENVDQALKQRNTLMSRKYPNNQRIRTTTPPTRRKVTQKVVTSDEYNSDPYWNIKNANIRNPNTPIYQDPDAGYDDASQSYGDDYAVELPKPGLIGLYSDHRQSWTHNSNKGFSYDTDDADSEEELESSLGYSSIDPRLDQRSSVESKPFRRRPLKLTATSFKEPMHNSQSPTISFHSNPDFQVLQGFKLPNLVRHKNRFVRKTPGTSEDCENNGLKVKDKTQELVINSEDYEDTLFEENLKQKMYDECGKTVKVSNCEKDEDQGVVEFGAHPWIALVVSTKNPQNVLCYATLIHSRAAVTTANCVYGEPPGAVSIITGLRNLDEDLELAQRRMVTVFLDSEYTSGNFAQNLALLHWKLPLTLDARIQPACLADVPIEDNCVFVGWGGYDQEMRPELRWQRASILAPQTCNKRLSKLQLNDALCAGVESRGTVTGIGGPLLCKNNDRWSTIGVAVWREDVVILLPPQDWVLRSMTALRIQ